MPEPPELEVVTAAAKGAVAGAIGPFSETAAKLLDKLFGGICEEMGGFFGDKAKDFRVERRQKRADKVLQKAKTVMDEASFEPQAVPDFILYPLLNAASLQDDETLQGKWANLLTNASDPRQEKPIPVPFVSMLGELTAREVKFLDALFEAINAPHGKSPLGIYPDKGGYTEEQLFAVYGDAGLLRYLELGRQPYLRDMKRVTGEKTADIEADTADFDQTIGILRRCGILSVDSHPKPIRIAVGNPGAMLANIPSKVDIETEQVVNLTTLGWSFIEKCREPKSD